VSSFPRPNRDVSQMRWVRAPISGARWQVHREVAPLLAHIVSTAEQRGYLFDYGPNDVDDEWGYSNRPIRGRKVASNHSWGLAGDVDAQQYPMGVHVSPPRWMVDLFDAYGFDNGATWKRPDGMHFEFRGWPSDARMFVAMLAASHVAGVPPTVPTSVPPPAPFTPLAPVRPQEDDMDKIIKRLGKDQFWFRESNGRSAWITKAQAQAIQSNYMKANAACPTVELPDNGIKELGLTLP